jgi:hypothetical protein
MGVPIFVGFLLFIYAGLIIVYFQQDAKQTELEGQISRTAAIVAKPMSDASELEAEYQDIQTRLKPLTRDKAIALLVAIAARHGVNIDPAAGGLVIPPTSVTVGTKKVGGNSYQVMSFGTIRIRSAYSNVMGLVSDLDAGATKETMVLTSLDIKSLDGGGDDAGGEAERLARAAELGRVQMAVAAMMAANNLTTIPNPVNHAGGVASDNMAAFPDPASGWLGSPGGKTFDVGGSAYRTGDGPGYVLYHHDDEADGSTGGSADYIGVSQTTYFYTCEADGTVRQFLTADRSGEAVAPRSEVNAVLSVDIYSLEPEEEE